MQRKLINQEYNVELWEICGPQGSHVKSYVIEKSPEVWVRKDRREAEEVFKEKVEEVKSVG